MGHAELQLQTLFSAEAIRRRVDELADQIAAVFGPEPIVLLPILSGSLIFVADLVRRLPLDMVIQVCGLSSYRGPTTEGAELRWTLAPPDDLAGRQVLIVDDILDSGRTIELVRSAVGRQNPATVRACVLLARESSEHQADFVGFQIGQQFVVGYGLDYDGRYRNLPDIAAIDR